MTDTFEKIIGNKSELQLRFNEMTGNNLILFSIQNCSPCLVFKECLPYLVNDFSHQFEVYEVPLVGPNETAEETREHFAIKYFPTLRYLQNGKVVGDLKGALQAEDHVNYARIYKWLSRFFSETET